MNDQFIQGVLFDWNKIDDDSYLKKIEAFHGIEKLEFKNPITFFVGENGSGKSTLLEAIAVAHGFNPEGGTKNYVFSTHDTHSELCSAIRITRGYRKEKWGYFLRAESFTMLRHRKRSMQIFVILPQSIMRNPMGRAFWRLHRTIFGRMDCISLMSRRRHCLRSGSLHC